MAADSRWSLPLEQFGLDMLLYVDEADYQKIITFGNSVFMFAGLCNAIDAWKYAIALASYSSNSVDWNALPLQGLCVSVVEIGTGNVRFDLNHTINFPTCSFAGSGASHAYACWYVNQNAVKAVTTAIGEDIYSGGKVVYHHNLTCENNFGFDKSLKELNAKLAERGNVVKIDKSNKPLPISEAVLQYPVLSNVVTQLSQGKITASAPFPNMDKPWSAEDKSKLVSVMESIFPKS